MQRRLDIPITRTLCLQISELGYAVLGYLDYARLVYASLSHIRLREILSLQLLIA